MKLLIEVITRGDGYLALATKENGLISEAGVGGGSTERQAVQESINSYFTRRDAVEAANEPQSVTLDAPSGARRVAVTRLGIESILSDAISSDRQVRIHYIDAHEVETHRTIEPFRLVTSGEMFPFVMAYDELRAGSERRFRIDRIKRAEIL